MNNYIKGCLTLFLLFGCHQMMAADLVMKDRKDLHPNSLMGSLWLNITIMASPCYIEHITPTRKKNHYHINLDGCGNPLSLKKEVFPLEITINNLNSHISQLDTNRIYDGQNTITFMAKGNDNVEVKINYQ